MLCQIKPNKTDTSLQMFTFVASNLRGAVEMLPNRDDTRQRMLRALEAEKRGEFVHSMTLDELEAMI
jgi:hypothetical protein